jgi:hypothetical protein
MVWFLLYAHRHRSILGAAGHIILTPANQLVEEYNSEPPEQSCLLRRTEKIASGKMYLKKNSYINGFWLPSSEKLRKKTSSRLNI